jgi:DNA/RNA endonuclease YhcR with UshA esterase domain
VWANRKALSGKTVTVRGKVVKVNPQIMGRNWLHIQDGTGKADGGTNDLTVTTDAMVKKGDIVTITGTVGVDKDFTAGYQYAVIVEDAKIK